MGEGVFQRWQSHMILESHGDAGTAVGFVFRNTNDRVALQDRVRKEVLVFSGSVVGLHDLAAGNVDPKDLWINSFEMTVLSKVDPFVPARILFHFGAGSLSAQPAGNSAINAKIKQLEGDGSLCLVPGHELVNL